jgi:hypothetical protein
MFVALFALAPDASAQSLAETEAWTAQIEYMDRSVADVKTACGVQIPYTFEKPSLWNVRENWTTSSPNGRCSSVYDVLGSMCRSSAAAKSAIATQVKSVSCGWGGKTSGFAFSIADGKIMFNVQEDRSNEQDEMTKILRESL